MPEKVSKSLASKYAHVTTITAAEFMGKATVCLKLKKEKKS